MPSIGQSREKMKGKTKQEDSFSMLIFPFLLPTRKLAVFQYSLENAILPSYKETYPWFTSLAQT